MNAFAWALFALFVVALGVRVTLSEAVWPGYLVETRPRRVVRGVDVVLVVVVLALAVALAAVVVPVLAAR